MKSTILSLLILSALIIPACSTEKDKQVNIDVDLKEFGLDTLQLRSFNSNQIDSLSIVVHENIKKEFLAFKNAGIEESKSSGPTEEYFGDKLYGYYLAFPSSENGVANLKRAFAIWSVSKAGNKMKMVLNTISLDKEYWTELAHDYPLNQLYLRGKNWIPFVDSRKQKAYHNQLSEWISKTKSEKSLTHLNFYFADIYFKKKDYEQADDYLIKVLELNRDSVISGSEQIVEKAQSYYNEIHPLQIGD